MIELDQTFNDGSLAMDDGWVTSYRFPVPWDGSPDVKYNLDNEKFSIVYPLRIDSGADQASTTGAGVTIAVVDSGVYFDPSLTNSLGKVKSKQFLGQADFVLSVCERVRFNHARSAVSRPLLHANRR